MATSILPAWLRQASVARRVMLAAIGLLVVTNSMTVSMTDLLLPGMEDHHVGGGTIVSTPSVIVDGAGSGVTGWEFKPNA